MNLMTAYIRNLSPISILGAVLLLLVILLATVSRLRLPSQLVDFVEIEYAAKNTAVADNTAAVFDDLLLKHRHYLSRLPLVYNNILRQPQQQEAPSFRIDQCGVKQGDFQRFVQWLQFNPNRVQAELDQPANWDYKTINAKHRILSRTNIPANGISYYDASAYCRANKGRLPTLFEYQAMTIGTAGNLYPWGNQVNNQLWPYLDPLLNATQKCGSQPQAATPGYQIHDLAHGMMEWASLADGHPKAVLVGASVNDKPHELYALNIVNRITDKTERVKYAGFRCAYAPEQTSAAAEQTSAAAVLLTPWSAEYQPILLPTQRYTVGAPVNSKVIKLLKITPPDEWHNLLNISYQAERHAEQAFDIAQCEVTRRQYRYFLSDPLVKLGFFAHRMQAKTWDYRPLNWAQQLAEPELPVVGVDWWSAYAFAQWLSGDLPTLEQWRVAASNSGQHFYPWGNDRQQREQYFKQLEQVELTVKACGNRQIDKTASGINDMSNNVSEWVRDIAQLGDGYGVTIAGGNYMLPVKQTSAIIQYSVADPEYRSMALGFRVVRD